MLIGGAIYAPLIIRAVPTLFTVQTSYEIVRAAFACDAGP